MSEKTETQREWINPIGGLGDALMLSGVLKLVVESAPDRRFNLVRRTRYQSIFAGHPAIHEIGYPPPGAPILNVDYWSHEELGPGTRRAFQVLARIFGLATPAEERLFFPGPPADIGALDDMIPWGRKVFMIAPFSDSPRKTMSLNRWEALVRELRERGAFVVQVGREADPHIRGAYALQGLTTPGQAIALTGKSDAVVTVDNFLMHAACLTGTRTVVLWGPTDKRVYGYEGQVHIEATRHCPVEVCLGPSVPDNYAKPCPYEAEHCMDGIPLDSILRACERMMERR
jgi:ADP-heptose:LPS heptosyltransferase